MDPAVARDHRGRVEIHGIAHQIRDPATGLFDEEADGGDVPRSEAERPKAVESSGGEPCEIEDGGAESTHTVAAKREGRILVQIRIVCLADVVRKARREQARVQTRRRRDGEPLVVHGRAASALGSVTDVLAQTLIQLAVPSGLRGRAGGAWVVSIGMAPLGQFQVGALASLFGVSAALGVNGLALMAVGVATALLVPRLRRL